MLAPLAVVLHHTARSLVLSYKCYNCAGACGVCLAGKVALMRDVGPGQYACTTIPHACCALQH